MSDRAQWLHDLGSVPSGSTVDGLVPVKGYVRDGCLPEEVAIMEKAEAYGAYAVFFEAGQNGRPAIAQAFIYVSDGPADDPQFGELHKRLWSWGGVPLVYRKTLGLVQLFRCAHDPDFISTKGDIVCQPFKTLSLAVAISNELQNDPLWDASQLRSGTLWDDPKVCKTILSADKAAHKSLINAVKGLNANLDADKILSKHLRRKLLILSLLIAYLDERDVFPRGYFAGFQNGATKFFEVLADGKALIRLLADLEERFNGNVFTVNEADREALAGNVQLGRFANLIEARQELSGQLTLWELYSFKDLPVEIISHIYQLFVKDPASSIYTPPFLVRLMLDEALSTSRLDRLQEKNEIVLDPACGSGIFLVEAYKRLVLHWRSQNGWKRPDISVLKNLLNRVHGIDLDEGAVELAAFSLCLALCDALEPETIRASIQLFPQLLGKTLHHSCFFEAKEQKLVKEPIGLITGNPPFKPTLSTAGAERSYERYELTHGSLPGKQLAYLFLHEAMEMVADGGLLNMLQPHGFLYNLTSFEFRRNFMLTWDVRELLDFISVRGLFKKGHADPKVVVVLAEATPPAPDRKILHATFRRSGRAYAEQGFDIDYYDLHWLQHEVALNNDSVWRTNLLGGGRVLDFVDRLKSFRSLKQFVDSQTWAYGEGFIYGNPNDAKDASHVVGKAFLPVSALLGSTIDRLAIGVVPNRAMQRPRREEIYRPPLLLIHTNMALNHGLWQDGYLTYSEVVFGISAAKGGRLELERLSSWLTQEKQSLQAFTACTSSTLLAGRSTAILSNDILSLPYPESGTIDLSANERVITDDILEYYMDLVRLGEDSSAMKQADLEAISGFSNVFARQINAIYKDNPLQPLPPQIWPGAICQVFAFGKGEVDWSGTDGLKDKLNALLHEKQGTTLNITRIARIYDENFIFLLKPARLRYWLRSVALRDADETLSDLRLQGF